MDVLDQLAVHVGIDHAVDEGDGVAAVAVGTPVAAAVRLGPDVNADQGRPEPGLHRLLLRTEVVLARAPQAGDVDRRAREALAGLDSLELALG
eukprot:3408576-Heterocapsa_arctica.AAC.1